VRARAAVLIACLALAAAPARAADVRETEVVGAVPLHADSRPTTPPRDAAVKKALSEAVRRVALQLLSEQDPADVEPKLEGALGADPIEYVTRFRVLEDRGERPALFSDDPEAKTEYVVMVAASVDADRIRDRLGRGGLLVSPAGEVARVHVRLEAEGTGDFAAYRALRATLLDGVGVRTALPVELERGRAVFDVDGELAPEALLSALQNSAPPGLTITRVDSEPGLLRVRVQFTPEPAPVGAGPARSRRIDTSKPNRY
jgi:hypothetical protein